MTYASPAFLHKPVKEFVKRGVALEEVLKLLTKNPADVLAKNGVKGCVAEGADADLLVLDENLDITGLFVRGKVGVQDGKVIMHGRFE